MTALLTIVQPDELRHTYEAVRRRLEEMSVGEDWLPEDVFHALLVNNAYLWVTPEMDGFVVLQVMAASYGRDLHVWLAHHTGPGSIGDYWAQLKEIAREANCGRVTFESSREGFARALPQLERRFIYSERVD